MGGNSRVWQEMPPWKKKKREKKEGEKNKNKKKGIFIPAHRNTPPAR